MCQMINVSIPVSDIHLAKKLKRDRAWVLDTIFELVPYAYDHGLEVNVGCEDASRADPEFLLQVAEAVQAAGARRIRYADTLGVMEPFGVHKIISCLAQCGGHRDRNARARRPRPGHRQQSGRRRGRCHAYQHHGERSGRTRGQRAAGRSRASA